MNRILLEQPELAADGTATLTDHRAAHIAGILKPIIGQQLRIGIVDGPIGSGTVIACNSDAVVLRCHFAEPAQPPSIPLGGTASVPSAGTCRPPAPPEINLLLALPRPKVMKRLWSPLASLGVRRILLTNACAVERNYFDTHWLSEAHYRPQLVDGLAQAGITRLPRVSVHRQLKPLIEDELDALFPAGTRLLAHPNAPHLIGDLLHPRAPAASSIREVPRPAEAAPLSWGGRTVRPLSAAAKVQAPNCANQISPTPSALLAVGPEGGWVPYELDLLGAHGFIQFRTGHEILRSDVACIALIALVKEHLDMPAPHDTKPHM